MPATDFPDIHYKSNSGPINFDTAKGIVECFVAGIGNKDSVGDVCVSGAFTKSLQRRKPRVVWGHVWNEPIGKVLEIYEVPANDARLPAKMRVAGVGGLYAKVQFNLGSERGREAFANVAFFGEEQEWSIGYKTLRSQQDPMLQANMLYEVELYEVSPVLHGANQMTATISVKDDQTAIEIGHADCPDGACDLAKDESSAPVEEKHIPVQDNTFDAVAIKIGNELSARSGSIINVISLEKAAVVFTRMAANGDVVTYRCGYHFDGLTFMFARPERTTPGINVPAVTPVIPSVSPQLPPVPVRPQMPLAPVVAPVVVVAPVQVNRVALSVPTVVKPGPMGMETVVLPQIRYENTPKPIDIAAAIERVRKRNGYKSLFDFGEVTETDFLDSVVTGNNPTSIPYIIPVAIKDAYAVKSLVDPILDYYRIEARVEPEGIVLSSGVTKDFADAVSLATKGLGRTIGRALSAVRPNIGAGRVGSPNLRGERKRGRGFNFGMPEGDTNPMTREDGNRDGTVFDGIPGWEQPDPTPGGAGSIDNREASAAQEAIAATSGKPDSGAIKKDEKKKPKLSSTTDPERKPRGNNLSREFGDMTEEEHALYGRYDEGGRERRDAATGRTARDDNAADKKRGQRDSAARSARLRQAEAAGDRGDRDDDEASRIKLSSGKTDRRHADRSAEMERTFPNSEENKKRLAHDATADTWRKDGFGWTEIPRYSGDKNRSPDYLRGREIGFNQGRLMWDGTGGHRTRPEKFNEKQKSSIQYADWYENLLNSVSRFVDAHKGGDDVDEWNGVEAGFKEVVITNAPDTSTWPSDRVKRLGDLMDRYDPSLRGKNPKSTGKLSSAHNAAGFNAGMEFIARIGAGREFNRENKKKKKNTARRANYPSTQPRLSSGAGKEIDAPEEEADRPPSGNIGSDYRRFDLETTDGGPNLLDGMHDEISRSPKLRSKIMGEIASMLGAAGLTEKNGYDTSRAFDVLTGSEKDFEDHIDALSDARAALGSGSYGMLKARLKEYESSAEHIKAQDAADGRLLRLEQNAKAIRERLTAIDRAKTLSAQRDDDAMNSADIGQLVLGKEENALWDARNDLANKYNVDKPEKLSSGKADKVADTLENHGDWEKTDDGIEIYPQGKDVAYQIGNVGKGKWAVTRHWDFERNAGQDAKEYEHDKIFASVSAAKKWADADFRRGENSEKPLPAAKRKKTSKSSSGKKNSKMINGVKIDVSPGAELDGADLDGANLKGANLKGAYLRRTDMGGADLSGANLVGADMTEAKLVNANLSDADLSDADLGGADLYFANLEGANLNGANLIGAKFTRAKLINANLTDTQMNGADLVDADLTGADLEGANLRKAKLGGTNLTGANLIGATMPDNTKWTPDTDMTKWTKPDRFSSGGTNIKMINGVEVDISPGANLEAADLTDADLTDVNLADANLRFAKLNGAKLNGAKLNDADLRRAKLTKADLTKADLTKATLENANLTSANLTNANLTGATLENANLARANLRNANLTEAYLPNANLARANLTGANLSDAIMYDTDLRSANLTGADLTNANLTGANLENADLSKADLTGADLFRTNLTKANLTDANLAGANLAKADLQDATMPDGTTWTPDTDLTQWTGAKKLSSGKTPKFKDDPLSPFKDLPEDSIVTLEGDKYRIYPGDRLSSGFTYGAETGIKTKDEMFEFLNAQLIDAIEKADPTSWKMPWRVTSMPNNPTTKKTYTGTNYMALSIIGSERGYASTQWAGYGQWEKVGGQVRKGAKGVPILVPIMFKPKDKDGAADPALGDKVKRGGMAWKVIRVFNRDEVDGLPDDYGVVVKLDEGTRVENLEKTLSEIAPTINHGGARAFYRPSDDAITVPAFADFKTARGYYGTVAHELMHWTGGEKRLKRANMNQFGSPEYAYEELIAEIASSMFLAAHGVEPDIQDNHAPYLASWLKALRSDPTALRRAMKQAQDAFNYAMGLSPSMTRLFKSEDEGGLEADTPDVAEIVTPDLGSGDKLSSGGRPRRRIVSLEDLPEYKFPTDKYEASPQQKTISNAVATGADVVVRALAGTGKTSTLGDIARRFLGEEPSTKTNDPPTKTGDLPVKMGATGMLTQKQKYTIKPGRIEIENGFLVKDRIKEAGGKWDGANKKWFVPLSDDSDEREVLKKLQNLTNRLATGGPSAETRIIYLAFNKSAELSAKGAMPSNTEVRTGDALAWAFVRNVNEKLLAKKEKGMRNLKGIAGYLGVKGILIERKGGGEKKELTQEDIVRALSHAVKHYSISEDDEISAKHFAPIQRKASGKVDGVNWDEFELPEVLVKFAQKYWNDLNDPDGKIYADFTHWTKMWALSRPDFSEEIPNSKNGFGSGVDIVFFDEAQDINPVMARVIREQTIQKVYVGDSNQAIYGFRGATDTLSEVKATYDLPLTESWRFNQAIADFANKFLVIANETELRVIGRGKGGKIVYDMQDADVIEVRTRGGALDAIRSELAKGRTVGVSKNFKTKLTTFILHAEHLVLKRSGKPEKQSDDLVGYESWKEVLDAVEKGDEPQLATLVAIVLEQGEGVDGINKLKDLLGRVREIGSAGPSDDPIDVEITTAHTSKGGEWPKVKIWKDFWGPRKNKVTGAITMPTQEEYRIAYVALTRPTSELDPGSLKWILEYVPDGDDRLSSGRRAARRAGAADKLSSGKKKKPSANARRRPASAEERQLFADGRRNRAQTIQGKKKPGPSTDEFTDGDTFSSGRAARLNRRLSSGGFNSTENDTAPAQRPWFIPEGLTGDSIGSIGKSDINPDRQTDFIGKLSDNDGYDGNADTPWYLDAKKFRDLLRDSTVDGDGKRIPGEPWSDAKVMELLNISEKNVRRLSEPGVGIKSSMVEHVMETVGDKNLHGYEMQERLEATWGFNAYPYWYDIDDEALSKKEYDRLVDRNRRGEVRTGSGYKPGDLEAPVALPDRAERPTPKVVTAEAAITSKKLPMERLYEFLELSPDDTMEEKEKKTGLRKADINNYVKNGLNPAVLRGLIARGTIPNAQTLFGEVGKTFDMQAPQPYLFLRIEDFLREKGHKVAGTPNLDFIVGEKNIAALIKKLRAKPDPLAVDARTKHYSPDELGAVVGRINEKFATDYVPDEIFPRDENGIPKKLSSGRASTSGSRRVFGSSSRGNRLGSGATVEARNLTGARGFELNRRINAIDDRIKKAGLSRGLATQARARAAKQNKLASGAKPATNITPKMQNELISWAKNGGKWSNFAKTMLAAFEENGKLSPGQWTRLMQIHDSTVKRR